MVGALVRLRAIISAPRGVGRRGAARFSLSVSFVILLSFLGYQKPAHAADRCLGPGLANLSIGFTLTHLDVAPEHLFTCGGGSRPGAMVTGSGNILLHYDDPAVAQRTQAALQTMASQGATVMRVLLWFVHAEDAEMAPRAASSTIGLAVARGGRLPDKIVHNLLALIADARRAGYRRIYVALGMQGAAMPQCRTAAAAWGGCYNPQFLGLTWSVERQIADTVRVVNSSIQVILDIAVEECYVANSPMLVDRNKEQFTRFMVKQYRDTYHDQNFIVSCGAGDGAVARVASALASLRDLYMQLGIRPYAIDIHNYAKDPNKSEQIMLLAHRIAQEVGVPLIIGETWPDFTTVYDVTDRLQRSGQLSSLHDLLIWPGHAGSVCHPNIALEPPYDMASVGRKLGLMGADSRRLPTCR